MVAFSRLPDACQLALFKQLPLEDQLRFRSVCRKWDSLIPVAASTRRSLIIILGCSLPRDFTNFYLYERLHQRTMRLLVNEDGSPMFPREPATIWNTLYFPRLLKKDNWHLIPTTFTGVEHLKAVFGSENPKYLVLFAKLLKLWRHQLTSVHLSEYLYVTSEMNIPVGTLYAAINSLPHLKRLVLDFLNIQLHDLPVIAQLEELDITAFLSSGVPNQYAICERHNRKLVKMLQKYGRLGQGLPRVGYTYQYGKDSFNQSILESVTGLCANMRHAFTRLDISEIGTRQLSTVCNHFQGLTRIHVSYSIDGNGLVPLFYELSKLKQLDYMWLGISIDHLRYKKDHRPLRQLLSVKALILELRLHTPQHMAALDIGWLFPNLQVIHFYFPGGNFFGCGFSNVNQFPNANLQLATECLRQMFRPLKRRFGNKLTILYNYNFRDGICPAHEFLAAM